MENTNISFNIRHILFISFSSALGGFLFGFDFERISGVIRFIRTELGLNECSISFLTGSLALGCSIGSLISGKSVDVYGRKPSFMLSAVLFAISSAGMAFSDNLNRFDLMTYDAGTGL